MTKLLFVFFLTLIAVSGTYWVVRDNLTLKAAKAVLFVLSAAFVSISILTVIILLF